MKSNQDYKNAALAALKGNWAPAVVCSIVLILATAVLYAPTYCTNMAAMGMLGTLTFTPMVSNLLTAGGFVLLMLVAYPMTLGYMTAHNRLLVNGDADLTANTFRDGFTRYLHNVGGMLLIYIFVFLWSLLLIIPGIIKAFSYALTPYILRDYPELSPNQAIELSMKMMKGHKFDYFWLTLSFIGWIILGAFTLGIGYLWLFPYMYTAFAAFYQDVRAEYESNNINQ